MCEIQFIKTYGKNLDVEDYKSFKTMMLLGSQSNKDAFGLFNSNYSFKEKGRFNTLKINPNEIYKDNFIIGHNRYATSGNKKNNDNNHPFKLNDFMLVHNGVISNAFELLYKNDIHSTIQTDSFCILALIDKYFKKNLENGKDRQTAIIKSIKKTAEKLEGFFSVFLFDVVTRDIYYFKDEQTDFTVFECNNTLICSTSKSNLALSYIDDNYITLPKYKKAVEIELDEEKIYLINDTEKFKSVGTFKKKKSFITNYTSTYPQQDDIYGNSKEFLDYDDKEQEINFIDRCFQTLFNRIPNYTLDKNTIRLDYDEEIFSYLKDICMVIDNKMELDSGDLTVFVYT